jgi:hypothetical protein
VRGVGATKAGGAPVAKAERVSAGGEEGLPPLNCAPKARIQTNHARVYYHR